MVRKFSEKLRVVPTKLHVLLFSRSVWSPYHWNESSVSRPFPRGLCHLGNDTQISSGWSLTIMLQLNQPDFSHKW